MKHRQFNFRLSGMFGQTLLVLLALTVVIGTFFGRFIGNLYEEQYMEKQSDLYFANIKERSSEADKVAASLNAKMESLLQMQSCNRLMVSGKSYLEEQAMSVVQELASLVERDEDVMEAYLYLPYSGKVLSSNKSVVNQEHFARPELLECEGNGIFCQNGEGFMTMAYPDAKPLARVILRLNLPELYRKMGLAAEQTTGSGMIYVYDGGGTPVFLNMLAYPSGEKLLVTELEKREQDKEIYRARDGHLLVYQSERTGWYLIQRMEGIRLAVEASRLRQALLTYGVLALVLLALASLYLIRRIYRPFRQLLATLVSQKNPGRQAALDECSDNELELIRSIAAGDEEQNKRLRGILRSVGASLSEHMFLQLLSGEPWEEHVIRETMAQIESPFPEGGPYRVIALRYWGREPNAVSPVDGEIYGLQLARYSEKYWEKLAMLQVVSMGERERGLVLCMRAAVTENAWYRELERFEKSLRRYLAERSFDVAAGGSDVAGSLFDLNVLWMQAETDLTQRIEKREKMRSEKPGEQLAGILFSKEENHQADEGNKEKSVRIERVKQIIEAEYGDSCLSLESVGERLGLTAPYLSRIFAEYQPPGFLDYLNRYRLEQAKRLLCETEDTIGDIGLKTGFNSPQSFIRVFKRYEGETPGQFRSRRKGEEE